MKRLYIFLVLLIAISTGTFAAEVTDGSILKGDMDGDNNITVADVSCLVNTLLGKSEKKSIDVLKDNTITTITVGDMNDDNQITYPDLTILVNTLLGHQAKEYYSAAYVDLGLSVYWSCCNLGANTIEGTGTYYTWSETIGEGDDPSTTLGDGWSTPTGDQMLELYNNTTHKPATVNGVQGVRITSKKNGNSIFLPFVVYYDKDGKINENGNAGYWGADLTEDDDDSEVWTLEIISDCNDISVDGIPQGYSAVIRPVKVH